MLSKARLLGVAVTGEECLYFSENCSALLLVL